MLFLYRRIQAHTDASRSRRIQAQEGGCGWAAATEAGEKAGGDRAAAAAAAAAAEIEPVRRGEDGASQIRLLLASLAVLRMCVFLACGMCSL